MALLEEQEVKLKIAAETIGTAELLKLAEQVAALADSGEAASPALEGLERSLRDLASQQAAVDTFINLKRSVTDLDAQLSKSQETLGELAASIKQAEQESVAAAQAQEQAALKLSESRDIQKELKQSVAETSAELKNFKEAAKKSGDSTGEYAKQIHETQEQLKLLRDQSKLAGESVRVLKEEHKQAAVAAKEA